MARKLKKNKEENGADIGNVMTCSLFLIILTFFILLNSIAVIDNKKVRMAIGSLTGAFGSFKGGMSPLKTGKSIMPMSSPIVKQKMNLNKLVESLNPERLDNIKVISRQDRSILVINEKALFEMNTHRLKPEASPFLNRLCHLANSGEYSLEIVGHTDNRSADEKGYRSNWELTSLMAIQVQKYLVDKGGVAPKRVTAYGHAGYDSIASNDTRESREQNRRIEIVFRYQMPSYIKKIFNDRPAGNFTYKRFNFKVF
jgi:chemotaxis protein MotB